VHQKLHDIVQTISGAWEFASKVKSVNLLGEVLAIAKSETPEDHLDTIVQKVSGSLTMQLQLLKILEEWLNCRVPTCPTYERTPAMLEKSWRIVGEQPVPNEYVQKLLTYKVYLAWKAIIQTEEVVA
jgi:hypothetical protein